MDVFEKLFAGLAARLNLSDFVLFFFRTWIAKVFYLASRSKVGDGFFTPSDTTIMLFEEEYALPIIDPELAAQMAIWGETFFSLMILVGIATRFGALGLLGMTLVIQILVYPGMFSEHATWIAALLPLIVIGAGKISIDQLAVSLVSKYKRN